MTVVSGEAILDADGFLHGWCWCAGRPLDRRVVEIILNDRLASATVASRYRDDLRERNIGDGYHGFAVALTSSLTLADPGCVISIRDRASGQIFWRETQGEFGLPKSLPDRIETLASLCMSVSQSRELRQGQEARPALRFAARLGQLGRYLNRPSNPGDRAFKTVPEARASLISGQAVAPLPFIAKPQVSVILNAGSDALQTARMISAVQPALHLAHAELLVLDSGADPGTALLPSIFPNLRYFGNHGVPPAGVRRQAAMAARGEILIFLNSRAGDSRRDGLERDWQAWEHDRTLMPTPFVDAVLRLAPQNTERAAFTPTASALGFPLVVRRSRVIEGQPRQDIPNTRSGPRPNHPAL